MTPEEFDSATNFDERYRYELIRGVLVVTPPRSIGERDPNGELGYWLRMYRDNHPQGCCLDLTVSEETVFTLNRRRADRVIWAKLGRLPDPEKDTPTIVVEFFSRSRRDSERDYVEKRDEYLTAGVTGYWVIDRFSRRMTVYRKPLRHAEPQIVRENETYQTDLLPGFSLPLARLLAITDRWRKTRGRPKPRGRDSSNG